MSKFCASMNGVAATVIVVAGFLLAIAGPALSTAPAFADDPARAESPAKPKAESQAQPQAENPAQAQAENPAQPQAEDSSQSTEIVYGDADAPVTIIEYASLTCPHCADFHTEILPGVKERLLDPGKAKLVYRNFPLDQLAVLAAVMVRCNTGTRRNAMLDVLFSTQETWATSPDPVAALRNIGRAAGMTDQALDACFNDQQIIDGVIKERLDAENQYQINSTPSFVVDGEVYRGGLTVEQITELVESLQPQ